RNRCTNGFLTGFLTLRSCLDALPRQAASKVRREFKLVPLDNFQPYGTRLTRLTSSDVEKRGFHKAPLP
ncbi:hypothetical protein B0H10DRAFT_1885522, partial [Mycena sp. CBHHK59/15]